LAIKKNMGGNIIQLKFILALVALTALYMPAFGQTTAAVWFKEGIWSEPLRVDNELSNLNSWREVYEKDEAALRPSIQDISSS